VSKTKVVLWQTYRFHGETVMVVQQWHDAFGRKMLRIEAISEGDDRGEGMPEDRFLQDAELLPPIGRDMSDR
jgi:hypothetical protein